MLPRSRFGRYTFLLPLAFILGVLVLGSVGQTAYADSAQVSTTVSLQYFSVQVEYPPIVLPGANAVVHVVATSKSLMNLNGLTVNVYYADGTNLHQLTSATIVGSQYVSSGDMFTKDVQVTVPQVIPRTSLFATFTESVNLSYANSYSSNYYGSNYDCSSYNYGYAQNCYYNPYYNSYPQYSYVAISDTGISSLSYVNATTPEYAALLSQYQTQQQQLNQAQSQNQNLQQQVNQQSQQISQLQSQNQQLQQTLQTAQNAVSQKNSDNSNLASQLNAANLTNTHLTYVLLGLGAVALLAAVLGYSTGRPKKAQSVNPYAANYVPPQNERQQTTQ